MAKDFTAPLEWILSNRYRLWFHIVFWLVIYLDELLSVVGLTPPFDNPEYIIIELSADLAMVYINLYYLIPRYLIRRKFRTYLLYTFITITLNLIVMVKLYYEPIDQQGDFISYIIGVYLTNTTLLGTAVGIKIFKNYIKNQRRLQELQQVKLETELTYLKNQINPHFLFNALNNIYIQSKSHRDDAPESLLQLSELLRYQLYDAAREKVPLSDEIAYLKNYLHLERLRKQNCSLTFEVQGDINAVLIEPFLFLPFVENAVKHGRDKNTIPYIIIRFRQEASQLFFYIENNKSKTEAGNPDGGIGLNNITRRLELLYHNRHRLKIKQDETVFSVDLHLQLRKKNIIQPSNELHYS